MIDVSTMDGPEKDKTIQVLDALLRYARAHINIPTSTNDHAEWRKKLKEIDQLLYGTCPTCNGTGVMPEKKQ